MSEATLGTLVLAIFIGLSTQASAGFINDTIGARYYFPDTSTLFADGGSSVVSPTATFNFTAAGYSFPTVTVGDTTVTATFDTAGFYQAATFNGFEIDDVTRNPGITGVTATSNISGFVASDVSFTSDAVYVNLVGFTVTTSSNISVTVQFSAVPEPSSVILLGTGILSACGLGLRLRRKAKALELFHVDR
jgi:hypothetical protein